MKKLTLVLLVLIAAFASSSFSLIYAQECPPNPFDVRTFTLNNGAYLYQGGPVWNSVKSEGTCVFSLPGCFGNWWEYHYKFSAPPLPLGPNVSTETFVGNRGVYIQKIIVDPTNTGVVTLDEFYNTYEGYKKFFGGCDTKNWSENFIGSSSITIIDNLWKSNSSSITDLCETDAEIDLRDYVIKEGGTFSGSGLNGFLFNPANASIGNNIITYTYDFDNGTHGYDLIINVASAVTAGNNLTYCLDEGIVTLTGGSPTGGTWSGTGVTGSQFNTAVAGAGSHTITYSFSPSCNGNASKIITVTNSPTVNAGTNESICINGGLFTLQGIPSGGTWSGTGVSGLNFNPQSAGIGVFELTYTVTGSSNCSGADTKTMTVLESEEVTVGADQTVCQGDAAFFLTGAVPNGGTWSGPGVSNGQFDPSVSGTGSFFVTYTVVGTNGCSSEEGRFVTVNPSPQNVFAGEDLTYCLNNESFNLTGQFPLGGVFTGPGVSGNTFDPALAGLGTHTISYTISQGACSTTDFRTITIQDFPPVEAGSNMTLCLNDGAINLASTASPAGGNFFGPGVEVTTFDPATAGIGTHTITYSVTNSSQCNGTDTREIVVAAALLVQPGPNLSLCTTTEPVDLTMGASPSGGVFSGTGVNGNFFDPSLSGIGEHIVTYTYQNGVGCSDSKERIVTVTAALIVNAGADNSTCINAGLVTLEGTPSGGTWAGTGVNGLNFDPKAAGLGVFELSYVVNGASNCTGSDSKIITVLEALDVTVGADQTVCQGDAAFLLTGATPNGGEWSGPFVSNNQFDPTASGTGSFFVTYTVVGTNGCSSEEGRFITVNASPQNVSAGEDLNYCLNNAPISLTGQFPLGGVFAGPGISGNTFDPVLAGLGTHTISYTIQGGDCSTTDYRIIAVQDFPPVEAGSNLTLCLNEAAIDLSSTASPPGGSFTGTGVSGNTFDPVLAGKGTHIITYSVTNSSQCNGSDTREIVVESSVVVQPGPNLSLCTNAAPIDLTDGVSPQGGVFIGTGVNGNMFDPKLSGVGAHTVTYTFQNGVGCSDSKDRVITVTNAPVVDAGADMTSCVNGGVLFLTSTNPSIGGSWSGNGVFNGNSFNPLLVGVGLHKVYFSYTSNNACTATDSILVNVMDVLTAPTITASAENICKDTNVTLDASINEGDLFTQFNWYYKGETIPFAVANSIDLTLSETTEILCESVSSVGCKSTTTSKIKIKVFDIDGDFNATETNIESGDYVKFTTDIEADTYNWDFGDDFGKSSDKSPSYYYYGEGTFTVKLTVSLDDICSTTVVKKNLINVSKEVVDIITGIEDEVTFVRKVYPNPFDNRLQLTLNSKQRENISIVLYNTLGMRVFESIYPLKPGEQTLEIFANEYGKLTKGMYLLSVKGKIISSKFRIIKK